ncbi:aldehyde dehydrogenase family protein [Rhizosaccharibacter radicis]|uniref:Aldehyde dehydrogenase n=1 Tax=Rhizosaccharibacter radicis TaxID=2782605 RepID=A0ABT1VUB4_9PROT|nr:aldehyde dehydrogenase family protein [Acetobacteraceae bacterium KSS12]
MPTGDAGPGVAAPPAGTPDEGAARDRLDRLFLLQRQASRTIRPPEPRARRTRLEQLERVLRAEARAIHDAISADFGHRAWLETVLAELLPVLEGSRFARRHLFRWTRPRPRRLGLAFQPGRAWTMPQPLGCVGIVSPWNYPLFLSVGPLVDALAAGNRVLLKPSEQSPRFSALLGRLLARVFTEDEVAVVEGGPAISRHFCSLPFDHLAFTGSTATGRAVARAAAENLTPLTLELGGKSPAILCTDRLTPTGMRRTARVLAVSKFFNAGQTCVAPDYVLVPADAVEAFADHLLAETARLFPVLAGNPDYTTLPAGPHLARLERMVAEAEAGGAVLRRTPAHAMEAGMALSERRFPPTIVLSPPLDSALMREEIFGPVLPLLPYRSEEEAVGFINARPRPLALYCFTDDRRREASLIRRTLSGGVAVNGALLQAGIPDLPFGGVGESGQGSWHGEAGFRRFSHDRPVYRPGAFSGFTTMTPPHGRLADRLLPLMLGRRR